jgi:ABC-type multidrug transport system ATPase subunit
MIDVSNLRKVYDDVVAVDSVSFSVRPGEVFALLGPNGAGKTTTIKSILGFTEFSGNITVDGLDIRASGREIRNMVGYLPERISFYDNLTAVQTLRFYAELKDVSVDARDLLSTVGLAEAAHRKVGGFSKGMVQRLGMAQCLLGAPRLLVLDEPTTGLDAVGAFEMRQKIKDLRTAGTTILLSSHILSEVQELSDRVAILNRGAIVAVDTVDNLSKKLEFQPRLRVQVRTLADDMVGAVAALDAVVDVQARDNALDITCPAQAKIAVLNALEAAGADIVDFRTVEPSLEEIFMRLVGNHA